jgi:hypothetical protein
MKWGAGRRIGSDFCLANLEKKKFSGCRVQLACQVVRSSRILHRLLNRAKDPVR